MKNFIIRNIYFLDFQNIVKFLVPCKRELCTLLRISTEQLPQRSYFKKKIVTKKSRESSSYNENDEILKHYLWVCLALSRLRHKVKSELLIVIRCLRLSSFSLHIFDFFNTNKKYPNLKIK